MTTEPTTEGQETGHQIAPVVHTPGPWTVHHCIADEMTPQDAGMYEIEEANEQINDLLDGNHADQRTAHAIAEANRRLIEAGPALVAALERVRHFATGSCDMSNATRLACIARECEASLAMVYGGAS